jgi:hypothetical protein
MPAQHVGEATGAQMCRPQDWRGPGVIDDVVAVRAAIVHCTSRNVDCLTSIVSKPNGAFLAYYQVLLAISDLHDLPKLPKTEASQCTSKTALATHLDSPDSTD